MHYVFVDLENAYDRVLWEELWFCMRLSGVVEKYVRLVQDIYESSMTEGRCSVGVTDGFKVEVKVHQRFGPEPRLVCYGDVQTDR